MLLRSGRIVYPQPPKATVEECRSVLWLPEEEDQDGSNDESSNTVCRHCDNKDDDGFSECPLCGHQGPYCSDCYRHHMQHCSVQKSLGSPCSDSDCDMSDDECIQKQPVEADDVWGNLIRQAHREVAAQLAAIHQQVYGP